MNGGEVRMELSKGDRGGKNSSWSRGKGSKNPWLSIRGLLSLLKVLTRMRFLKMSLPAIEQAFC